MSQLAISCEKRTLFPSRLVLLIVVLLGLIGIDQYTKKLATEHLKYEPAISWLDGSVRMQYAENPGAFLGLGGSLSPQTRFILFALLNGLFLSLILMLLWKQWQMPLANFIALSMLLAGGIGNLIDRLTQQGMVTDFLNLGIGSLRTGIFNVADVAISAGVLLLCVAWNSEITQPEEKA